MKKDEETTWSGKEEEVTDAQSWWSNQQEWWQDSAGKWHKSQGRATAPWRGDAESWGNRGSSASSSSAWQPVARQQGDYVKGGWRDEQGTFHPCLELVWEVILDVNFLKAIIVVYIACAEVLQDYIASPHPTPVACKFEARRLEVLAPSSHHRQSATWKTYEPSTTSRNMKSPIVKPRCSQVR